MALQVVLLPMHEEPSVSELKMTLDTSIPSGCLGASTFQIFLKLFSVLSIGHNLMMIKGPTSRVLLLAVG